MFKSKSLPIFLYCTEMKPVKCLKLTLNPLTLLLEAGFFVKLLKINNADIVKYSQDQFGFKLPSELIPNRTAKFIAKLLASDCV